jgi:hypothetical protein
MASTRLPHKPKTHSIPITGQSVFVAERLTEVEGKHPDLTRVQIFAFLNNEWAKLDDAIRAAYERKADYSRRTESRRSSSLQHRSMTHESESKVSAYSMFVKKQHDQLKVTNPEMTVSDRAMEISKLWAGMSKSQKLPFVNEAKRETRKLRRESVEEDPSEESESE